MSDSVSKSRGRNFLLAEDKALCHAWLNTRGDAGKGTNQSATDFYRRVKVVFDEEMRSKSEWVADRETMSLSNRFSTISHDVSKFVACHTKVTALDRSGSAPTDVEHEAIQLYESGKKNGKFRFLQCWYMLKDSPKWGAWRTSKQTTRKTKPVATTIATTVSTPTSAVPSVDNESLEATSSQGRPQGQKRAKLEEANRALYARQVKATERMAMNGEARNRAVRDQIDLNIFAAKPNVDDTDATEYCALQRMLILASVRKEAAALASTDREEALVPTSAEQNATDNNHDSEQLDTQRRVSTHANARSTDLRTLDPNAYLATNTSTSSHSSLATEDQHTGALSDASILLSL